MKKAITQQGADTPLYDSDFFAWTQRVASDIRNSRLSPEDAEYVAEEIADMGKRDQRELRSRMTVLVMHLMKWAVQRKKRSGSWKGTIREQRDQLNDLLSDSPSLRVRLVQELPIIYSRSAFRAAEETDLLPSEFMRAEAFRGMVAHIDKLLSTDWLPNDVDDLFN